MDSELKEIVDQRILNFKDELKNLKIHDDDCLKNFITKWLIEGDNFFIEKIFNQSPLVKKTQETFSEYNFKNEVAGKLGISSDDVIIMGSSKNGFSLKPEKNNPGEYKFNYFKYNLFEGSIDLSSDIDLTIISGNLFDQEMEKIYKHTKLYSKKYLDLYFENGKNSFHDFSRYILRGWIKPDQLPKQYSWSETFDSIAASYRRKFDIEVTIALFKSKEYYMTYNRENLRKMHTYLLSEDK